MNGNAAHTTRVHVRHTNFERGRKPAGIILKRGLDGRPFGSDSKRLMSPESLNIHSTVCHIKVFCTFSARDIPRRVLQLRYEDGMLFAE